MLEISPSKPHSADVSSTAQNRHWRHALWIGAMLGAATLLGWLLHDHVSLTSQAMLYVLAVVVLAYRLPRVPSLFAAVLAVCAFNFFYVPPRFTLEVGSQENVLALLAMLVLALVISHLSTRLQARTAQARLQTRRALQLQSLAGQLVAADSTQTVLQLGQSALAQAFEAHDTWLLVHTPKGWESSSPITPSPQHPDSTLHDGLHHCMRERATLGPGTGRWPGLEAWYIPLLSHPSAQAHGAACIRPAAASDEDSREHAQALCALLAQALQQLAASHALQETQLQHSRQQLESTFLAAISHDMRTPLTSILGAASALQEQGERLGATEQQRLLDTIHSEAIYLSQVTENTLELLRIRRQPDAVVMDWQSVEEIVGSVMARLRRQHPQRTLQARVPAGLPLLRANAVLLAQALTNLLDNALHYSQDQVELEAKLDTQTTAPCIHLSVKDRGATIDQALRPQLFEPYSRGDMAKQQQPRGAGLGLALCQAIAQLHGGTIAWYARPNGGNRFTLSLPMPLQPQEPV
ncbi:DUF4118 domain-containing protein [Curvibacter sp. CHRR-16]|uniref:DUF4118 domain-containing protein n=1 Tax=Curvibacter sp. CHRR-16 TaxID=2835872 RepID=UPI001BD9DF50|nr:DUF4118 domain-containing protein [Curvibacter sp. CHRR-16]MBT0569309.1 DUF4118 domain-containing protein [Curvibacter sp. CHRR-16]